MFMHTLDIYQNTAVCRTFCRLVYKLKWFQCALCVNTLVRSIIACNDNNCHNYVTFRTHVSVYMHNFINEKELVRF